jgi:alkanesulfonate monooxygenase SsuD/methylene tetrahydromethanopterin reductase-like flavin-dependent oxidoreductase (luciferase family)
MRWDDVKEALYPDTADVEDFSYARIERLLSFVRGEPASPFKGTAGIEVFSERVEPHSPGLASRIWYGGASTRSAQWTGEQGLNLLTSSVVKAEEDGPTDFADIQLGHVRTFRAHHVGGDAARVSQGLVVIPTDSATAEQRAKYTAYVESRLPRTAEPQGPARMMFAPDLIGSSSQIAEQLYAHAAFREIDEVAFALPFSFAHDDYVQILTDLATGLGPALGWRPGRGSLGGDVTPAPGYLVTRA